MIYLIIVCKSIAPKKVFHSNCVQLNPINDLHIAIDVTGENCSKWFAIQNTLSPAHQYIFCMYDFHTIYIIICSIDFGSMVQQHAANIKWKHNYIVVGIAFGL